jgi:phosphopantetheinyl transferase
LNRELRQALAESPQGFVVFAHTAGLERQWPELAGTLDARALAHVLKVRALGHWLKLDHRRLQFAHSAFGRPLVQGDARCDLSLSHVATWVAVGAVSDGSVGVDVQTDRSDVDWHELAAACPKIFHDPAMEPQRLRARWCRCEARGKATGVGVAGGTETGLAVTCRAVALPHDATGAWCWSQDAPPRVWLLSAGPAESVAAVQELSASSTNHGRHTVRKPKRR